MTFTCLLIRSSGRGDQHHFMISAFEPCELKEWFVKKGAGPEDHYYGEQKTGMEFPGGIIVAGKLGSDEPWCEQQQDDEQNNHGWKEEHSEVPVLKVVRMTHLSNTGLIFTGTHRISCFMMIEMFSDDRDHWVSGYGSISTEKISPPSCISLLSSPIPLNSNSRDRSKMTINPGTS